MVIVLTLEDFKSTYVFYNLSAGTYTMVKMNSEGFDSVSDIDRNKNDKEDESLARILLVLLDSSGVIIAITTTASDGNFEFKNVLPGDFTVVQTNFDNVVDVSDLSQPNNGHVPVAVKPCAALLGSISGNVSNGLNNNDIGNVYMAGVQILLISSSTVIASTLTDSKGNTSMSTRQ